MTKYLIDANVSPYQMLRRERARFVLGPSGGQSP